MNNLFYFKVCIRCFLPNKERVRNFHKTEKGHLWSSCKSSWNKFNDHSQSESLFEVLYKRGEKAPPSHSYSIYLLTQGPITTLLRPRLAAPGWSQCQTLNHHHRVSGTWVVFGRIPFKHCPSLSLSSLWELTRPQPGVLWLEAAWALQWSQTEVKFITECLKC